MYPIINGMSPEFYDSMMNGIVRDVTIKDDKLVTRRTNLVIAKKSVISSMNSEYRAVIQSLENELNLNQKSEVWFLVWRLPKNIIGTGFFGSVLSMLSVLHNTKVMYSYADEDGEDLEYVYVSVKLAGVKDYPILIDVPGVLQFRSIIDNSRQYLKG